MTPGRRRIAAFAAAAGLVGLVGLVVLGVRLRQDVRRALLGPPADRKALQLVPLARPARLLVTWSGPEIEAVAFPGGDLVTAGASGVQQPGRGDLTPGLPTRRATALASWAGELVVALEAGGVAVRRDGVWHELRSGWGVLHARVLLETPAGELLVGAQQGLFRAARGAMRLDRLDAHPVRALALGSGVVWSGGEAGLWRVEPGRAVAVATPDPWIDAVAVAGDVLMAVTPAGLARGPLAGPLEEVAGAETVAQAVWHQGTLWATSEPADAVVRTWDGVGRTREERLPVPVRRIMVASGRLFADAADGLHRRDPDGWRRVVPRAATLPAGHAHVTALARFRDRLHAGFFDGGLASAEGRPDALVWREVPGTEAWGTNALLSTGGQLWAASLRGVARHDGSGFRAVEGPGAAFALAATREGMAIGYGVGVKLPDGRLLSAFHGLPGNQALALAEADQLYVGTPSGLGAVAASRVSWRVTSGEGKLPHPWVTALLPGDKGLLVGTWGGGLVRRKPGAGPGAAFVPYPETNGLEVSPGAITEVAGRAWVGTDADGLWREVPDGSRFERVSAALPSPRVTALLAEADGIWVGTDQGVTWLPLPVER